MDPRIREKTCKHRTGLHYQTEILISRKESARTTLEICLLCLPFWASEQSPSAGFQGAANRADLRAVTRSSTSKQPRAVVGRVPGWSLTDSQYHPEQGPLASIPCSNRSAFLKDNIPSYMRELHIN